MLFWSFFLFLMIQIFTSGGLSFSLLSKSSFLSRVRLVLRSNKASIGCRCCCRRSSSSFHSSTIQMMPEGPEVRTLVDQLQGGVGMRLVNVQFVSGRHVRQHGMPDGFGEFAKTMTPITLPSSPTTPTDVIQEWNQKGKFIYICLDNGTRYNDTTDQDFQRSIWITLGMSGRFINERCHDELVGNNSVAAAAANHARWYFQLLDPKTNTTRKIYYHDARNFGTLKFCLSREALSKKLDSLGLDILANTTTEDDFGPLVSAQKPELNVCTFLMNQSKLCGIGNYILAEGLYRASIDPFASLCELDELQQRRLFRELQATALESYEAQGLSRQGGSYRNVDNQRGKFEFALQCYGREFCARGKRVIRETNGPHGRTIWYTEDQLFMPRIMRYGAVAAGDNGGHVDDVEAPVSQAGAKRNREEHREEQTLNGQEVHSKERLLAGLVDNGWKDALSDAIESPSFDALATFVSDERARGATIFPPEEEIFSALNMCPFDKVQVVIVGQDPYHGRGQGHGLAFSVRKGVRPPPSLKNIFKEAMDDVGIDPPKHGYLQHWAEQGVLLLNAVLTVREGEANSHAGRGWEEVTDSIIDKLNTEKDGLVFLLWGNPAQKKAKGVDEQRHTVIRTSHPSPLGATKTASPFLGSRCFSRANEALENNGKTPIDWNVR